ncbi:MULTISPECIES: hypothetical protein [Streptomyces]|nr:MULTISPECIES: hypothetical protein [Streptomyces]
MKTNRGAAGRLRTSAEPGERASREKAVRETAGREAARWRELLERLK